MKTEINWSDVTGSTEKRLDFFEDYLTSEIPLIESNEQSTVDYFLQLPSDKPETGIKYTILILGMINNKVSQFSNVENGKIVAIKSDHFIIDLEDGQRVEYPSLAVRKNMTVKTFFFKTTNSYNKFRVALKMKFDVDLEGSELEESKLFEGTDNLYHYAPIGAALKILQTKQFELSSSEGNKTEDQWTPKGYTFYLSTTRSKVGDYHTRQGNSAVIFNLDGRWLNQRYPVKPIDYWEGMWIGDNERTSESEDRVFSKAPAIPITPVQSIHLLYKEDGNKNWNHFARNIMLEAKKAGIPVYLYGDAQSWLTQDKRKVINVKDAGERLKGPSGQGQTVRRKAPWILAWVELYHKQNLDDLGERALRQAKDVNGQHYGDNPDFGLSNDLRNAAKPNAAGRDAALKILQIMKKNGWSNAAEFAAAMTAKWKPKFEEKNKQISAEYQRVQQLKKKDEEDYKAMQTESVLVEANRGSVILVDFQPAYETDQFGYVDAIEQAMEYINQKRPSVTAFYNGADVGIEDQPYDVAEHFVKYGLDEDLANDITYKEKSYAWLRSWSDQGISKKKIIQTLRYMVMNDLNDSRDIDTEVLQKLLDNEYEEWVHDDAIYIPDISIGNLKTLSGSLIGGGGRHECLEELRTLMDAFNIKYQQVNNWIYG
jgi:hypothetical protein